MKSIEKKKFIQTLIKSDAGTEKVIVESLHTGLRTGQADELSRLNSFLTGKRVHIQHIESCWAQLRKLVTGFYIDLFELMQHKGVLNTTISAHLECLRVCLGPLIKYDLKFVRNCGMNIGYISKVRKTYKVV